MKNILHKIMCYLLISCGGADEVAFEKPFPTVEQYLVDLINNEGVRVPSFESELHRLLNESNRFIFYFEGNAVDSTGESTLPSVSCPKNLTARFNTRECIEVCMDQAGTMHVAGVTGSETILWHEVMRRDSLERIKGLEYEPCYLLLFSLHAENADQVMSRIKSYSQKIKEIVYFYRNRLSTQLHHQEYQFLDTNSMKKINDESPLYLAIEFNNSYCSKDVQYFHKE